MEAAGAVLRSFVDQHGRLKTARPQRVWGFVES